MFIIENIYSVLLIVWTSLVALILVRLSIVLPMFRTKKRAIFTKQNVPTMIIWGSGGHTGEMMLLLKSVQIKSFQQVFHVISQTDQTSRTKIVKSEIAISKVGIWHTIVRSREVKQSWLTTIFSTIASFLQCFWLIAKLQPRLIICNGPGTCVPICYSAFFIKLIGWSDITIVFVESFCRVEKLSLTGRLLYPIADHFIVQWIQLLSQCKRAEYLGDLGER